ncbi:MAG: site-2 protease family protein, partial [Clostridia bacterium]|nr:site-2 protease family protein [Clostridia bacterium]
MIVLYILLAIFIFGFMIFIHELGHFMFAKIFKVTIKEFSIGMGPKIFSKTGKDNVAYSLRLLPFGGYVAMVGEDEDSDDPNAFNKKSAWKRFIIILAGAVMNLLVGIIIMTILTATTPRFGTTVVGQFNENSTSIEQLQLNDKIIKVGNTRVNTASELSYEIMRKGYKPVDLTVIREGNKITLKDVEFPTVSSQGVVFGAMDFKVYGEDRTFGTVVKNSFYSCKSTIKMIYDSLFDLITGRYGIEQVSGPVGITGAITDAAKTDAYSLFYLIVVISMNLGIFNLLPIPALDGGSLLLLLVEMIIRKPIPSKIEYAIKAIGFALIMGLAVIIMLKDVIFLFK